MGSAHWHGASGSGEAAGVYDACFFSTSSFGSLVYSLGVFRHYGVGAGLQMHRTGGLAATSSNITILVLVLFDIPSRHVMSESSGVHLFYIFLGFVVFLHVLRGTARYGNA